MLCSTAPALGSIGQRRFSFGCFACWCFCSLHRIIIPDDDYDYDSEHASSEMQYAVVGRCCLRPRRMFKVGRHFPPKSTCVHACKRTMSPRFFFLPTRACSAPGARRQGPSRFLVCMPVPAALQGRRDPVASPPCHPVDQITGALGLGVHVTMSPS